jgi:hypothetical protein
MRSRVWTNGFRPLLTLVRSLLTLKRLVRSRVWTLMLRYTDFSFLACLQNCYLRNATIISTEGTKTTNISKEVPLYEERRNCTGAMQVRENPSSKLWKSKLQDPQIRSARVNRSNAPPHDVGLRSSVFNLF